MANRAWCTAWRQPAANVKDVTQADLLLHGRQTMYWLMLATKAWGTAPRTSL